MRKSWVWMILFKIALIVTIAVIKKKPDPPKPAKVDESVRKQVERIKEAIKKNKEPKPDEAKPVSAPVPVPVPVAEEITVTTVAPHETTPVIIVDKEGQPIEGAAVQLLHYNHEWKLQDWKEVRTDAEGLATLAGKLRATSILYVNKPGRGWQLFKGHELKERLTLLAGPDLTVRCTGPNEQTVPGVQVTIIGEFLVAGWYDGLGNEIRRFFHDLPPRTAQTDDEGRCVFQGFPNMGPDAERRPRKPDCRFVIRAKWKDRVLEQKIDGFPKSEVSFKFE